VLLHDFLDYWAREQPEAEFAVAGQRSVRYGTAAAAANRVANRLIAGGWGGGTRVAVLAKNAVWYPILYFAASKAGAVLVPVNWRLAPAEWRQILLDARPRVVVVGAQCAQDALALREELDFVEAWVVAGEDRDGAASLEQWLSEGPATAPEPRRGAQPDDAVYQMYTSGTTGMPKGAVLSHRAVVANVWQVSLALPVRPGERGLVVLPMFHAAIIPAAFAVLCRGGCLVVLDAFDPDELTRVLERERISVATLVPAMLRACLDAATERRYDDLRCIYYGASAIAQSTLGQAMEAFGCDFVQSYGMTEAAQALTFLAPGDHRLALTTRPELLLSAGRPALSTRLQIDERGEILARGPQLMSGYWQRHEDTAQTLRDGWLYTGDVGRIDDEGYLFVEDRIKDMVVSGGENVFPRVVEDVLHAHPAIAEAAVIGVPDERWGEAVKAVVVLRHGASCSEQDIVAFCRPRLGGFERPQSVDFVASLPRTATGKVLKRVLREPYWSDRGRRVSGA
jgi:acyl-CoA synthetase (AMP-forming)/AMP-acid ligase II